MDKYIEPIKPLSRVMSLNLLGIGRKFEQKRQELVGVGPWGCEKENNLGGYKE